MLPQLQQEGREQVLELVALPEDLGLGEALRGREALEGLDEAGFERVLDIGVDGPGPGLHRAVVGTLSRRMEADGRAEGEQLALRRREIHQRRGPAVAGQGHHRIGGAEIDADRTSHGAQSFGR
jgi:hypothetical protein